jgi:hypothetical protein
MSTPVSGPGQFSKRTDKAVSQANRSLPNADYGEQAQYQDQLSGAPMAQDQGGGQDFASMFGNPSANVVGLGEDTTMPDVPVTDGADSGPGAGSEVLSGGQPNPGLDKLKAYLPALEYMADNGNSDAARNLVRQIQAQTM